MAASANIRLSAPACNEQTSNWRHAHEAPPPKLPPLHLVTGWSKADPAKVKHNPKLALFGGWRIEDWEKRKRSRR